MDKELDASVVNAEEFRLVDNKGNLQAVLTSRCGDGPSLRLYDGDRCERLVLGLGKGESTHFTLLKRDGSASIGIGTTSEGRTGLTIWDDTGKPGITLLIHPDGSRQIDIYAGDGKRIWNAPRSANTERPEC